MGAKAKIGGGVLRVEQLLHRPRLPSAWVALHGIWREAVECDVVRGMHGDELALQMRGQFRQMQAVSRQGAGDFVAIGLAFGGALQIEEAPVPRRNLYALVAQAGGPLRDAF